MITRTALLPPELSDAVILYIGVHVVATNSQKHEKYPS